MLNSTPSSEAAVAYVEALQRDGRLLLRYVARKTDRPLAGPGGGALGAGSSYVLTTDPAAVAADPAQFAALTACIDDLSRRASPATVTTIRITSAYLRLAVEGGEPPETVTKQVRRLHRWMRSVTIIAVLTTLVSVLLLAHVDDGRRAVQQLVAVRADLAKIRDDLEKLPEGDWSNHGPHDTEEGSYVRLCAPRYTKPADAPAEPAPGVWRAPRSARANTLCGLLDESSLREDLVFIRLASWNCLTNTLMRPWHSELALWARGLDPHEPKVKAAACGEPNIAWPSTVEPEWWQRTEIRAAASMSVLSGFILPLLLGCIGGCAYGLRRLDQKLSDWTLEARDGLHSAVRVLLATMLGGLLGLVWSGDEPIQLGGYALSLAAAAFFVGFSLEVIFTVIESMVDGVAGKLRAPATAPVAIPVAVASTMPASAVAAAATSIPLAVPSPKPAANDGSLAGPKPSQA